MANENIKRYLDTSLTAQERAEALADELTTEEKTKVKADIKAGLEGLAGKIPGLVEIHVQTQSLESSNADLMLDSTFEDEASLKGYAVHPEHVSVADGVVRPNTKNRVCLDFVK